MADADALTIPILAIIFALGIALASFYLVYIAPVLFAEVLVDGALSYVLFRRLGKQGEQQHWLSSTLRRTMFPFIATAVFLIAVGAGMSIYAPGANSIEQVMKYKSIQQNGR